MSNENNKLKLFVENMLVYGLGSMMSKLVPLVMLFVVTYIFPTTEQFSFTDNTHTIQQLFAALAVMGMYDAMYRMFFERDDIKYKKEICSTAMVFTACSSVVIVILMVIFKEPLAQLAFKDVSKSYLIYIAAMATLVSATNNIVSAPTRMQNKRKVFLFTNTITPILSYSIAIPLMLNGYYVIALPISAAVSGLTIEIIFGFLNHSWFSVKNFRKEHLKPLLKIALPLLPNFLVYWLFGSCDRIMLVQMIGNGQNGIYGASARLGHCSQLIYQAFSNGWQFFAFSTMKEKDQVKNNSSIFEYLGAISFVSTSFLCAFIYHIFFLMDKKYIDGYISAAYLFLAPLLQMLFQVACNQFLVVKKTWPNVFILSFGAVVNVVLNMVLIPRLGIEGASIATLGGYVVSDIMVCIVLMKMKLMVLTPRFYAVLLAFVALFLSWRLFYPKNILIGLPVAILYTIFAAVLYKKELAILLDKIKNRKKKSKNV